MVGPEGCYRLTYSGGGDGVTKVEVAISGLTMTWPVVIMIEEDDGITLCGMTSGSQALWRDQFWFELRPDARPPRIDYWGDQILWRSDQSINTYD
jgi:hypothetical protein